MQMKIPACVQNILVFYLPVQFNKILNQLSKLQAFTICKVIKSPCQFDYILVQRTHSCFVNIVTKPDHSLIGCI